MKTCDHIVSVSHFCFHLLLIKNFSYCSRFLYCTLRPSLLSHSLSLPLSPPLLFVTKTAHFPIAFSCALYKCDTNEIYCVYAMMKSSGGPKSIYDNSRKKKFHFHFSMLTFCYQTIPFAARNNRGKNQHPQFEQERGRDSYACS